MENTLGFEATFDRVKQLTGWKTQQQLCEFLDVTSASVSGAKKRDNFPTNWAFRIARQFHSSTDWLLTGDTTAEFLHMEAREHPLPWTASADDEGKLKKIQNTNNIDNEILMISMVEARLLTGTDSFEASATAERHYAFCQNFLRGKGQINHMVLMRVTGDSMSPEIRQGDTVLIDQSQKELNPGQIYAVGIEGLVYLKRIDTRPGKLILHSINAAEYPPFEIDLAEQGNAVRILGRCIWSCREW